MDLGRDLPRFVLDDGVTGDKVTGAFEKISWGRPVFCAPKMFAVYGGSVKSEGEWVRFDHSVLVKVDSSERKALEQDSRFFYPGYMAPSGWLGLDLTAAKVDWNEVKELIDASFRLVANGAR